MQPQNVYKCCEIFLYNNCIHLQTSYRSPAPICKLLSTTFYVEQHFAVVSWIHYCVTPYDDRFLCFCAVLKRKRPALRWRSTRRALRLSGQFMEHLFDWFKFSATSRNCQFNAPSPARLRLLKVDGGMLYHLDENITFKKFQFMRGKAEGLIYFHKDSISPLGQRCVHLLPYRRSSWMGSLNSTLEKLSTLNSIFHRTFEPVTA